MSGPGGALGDDRPPVAAVVVTHDTCEEALACLATLADAGAAELVVVDAGSTDGTVRRLAGEFPEVTVVALDNVGYARAANAGVARTTAPVVVVANADTRFASTSLSRLAAVFGDHPELGAAGPRVRYPDGRRQASARRLPTLGQAAGHATFGLVWPANPWTRAYRMLDADGERPAEVDWVSGCAMAVRRQAFDEVAGFDPRYFMFVEDVDLCYRLRRAGWGVRYVPEAEVEHRVGASTRRRRASMVVSHARSLARFYDHAYARGAGRLLKPVVLLGLAGWVALVLAWGAVAGVRRGRSTTGE